MIQIDETQVKALVGLLEGMLSKGADPEEYVKTFTGAGNVTTSFKINKVTKRITMFYQKGETVIDFNNRKSTTFQGFAQCMLQAVNEAHKE